MKITSRKVVVIGTGFVGTSIAYSMINQGLVNELVLIDVNQDKAEGEALDLLDGISWAQENVIVRAGNYCSILNNEQVILPVSAYLRGEYGQEGVFTGVPSVVNQNGVREIIELNIDAYEMKQFEKSVSQLKEVIESIK